MVPDQERVRPQHGGQARDRAAASRPVSGEGAASRRRAAPRIGAARAGQAGLQHIAQLTGKPVEGVTAVEPADNGWQVAVEVLEDRRIPAASDVLARYDVQLDLGGALLGYRRVRRYSRGRADADWEPGR